MAVNIIDVSNKITSLTNEIFADGFHLGYEATHQNNKIMIILDTPKREIEAFYHRVKDTKDHFHAFSLDAYYVTEHMQEEEYRQIISKIDGTNMIDIIFVMNCADQILTDILDRLYEHFDKITRRVGAVASNYVRFIFFRIFTDNKDTSYFRQETRSIAKALYAHYSKNHALQVSRFVGTRIYNYLMDAEKIDMQCVQFVDKIYSMICWDDLVECGHNDQEKFCEEDCPWYTFKIRKMYIPELILVYSLIEKLKGIFFASPASFSIVMEEEVKRARKGILQKLGFSTLKEIEQLIQQEMPCLPIPVEEKEYEDARRQEERRKIPETKVFGFNVRLPFRATVHTETIPDYQETSLNTEETGLSENFLKWVDQILPVETLMELLFDAMQSFIDFGQGQASSLVEEKVKKLIDGVFSDDQIGSSNILKCMKEKFKQSVTLERINEYSLKISNATNTLISSLTYSFKKYKSYITGLNANNMPTSVIPSPVICCMTKTDSMYQQLINYLEEKKVQYKNDWVTQTNGLKDALTLTSGYVYLPLLAEPKETVTRYDPIPFPLSDFEKQVKRESVIYLGRGECIDSLQFGFDG